MTRCLPWVHSDLGNVQSSKRPMNDSISASTMIVLVDRSATLISSLTRLPFRRFGLVVSRSGSEEQAVTS